VETTWIGSAFISGLAVKWVGNPPLVGFLFAGVALNAIGYERSEPLDRVARLDVLLPLFSVGLKVRFGR